MSRADQSLSKHTPKMCASDSAMGIGWPRALPGPAKIPLPVATMGIDEAGNTRFTTPTLLNVIQAMQDDADSSVDEFQSQTSLLTKINTASVLGLRIGEKTNEFLADALDQLTVDSTRRRQTEAALLNATIKQWRYGQALGDSLFQNTAANIDGW